MPRPPALTLLLGYSRGKERGHAVPTLPSFSEALAPQIARRPSWAGSEEGAVLAPCGDIPTARGASGPVPGPGELRGCGRGWSCRAVGTHAVGQRGRGSATVCSPAENSPVLVPGATRPVGDTASPALWDGDDTPQLREELVSEARRCRAADLPEAMGDSRSVPQTLGGLWRVPGPCCPQGDVSTGRHTQQGAAGGDPGSRGPGSRRGAHSTAQTRLGRQRAMEAGGSHGCRMI